MELLGTALTSHLRKHFVMSKTAEPVKAEDALSHTDREEIKGSNKESKRLAVKVSDNTVVTKTYPGVSLQEKCFSIYRSKVNLR